jgi:hypothetical protein
LIQPPATGSVTFKIGRDAGWLDETPRNALDQLGMMLHEAFNNVVYDRQLGVYPCLSHIIP